MIRNKHDRTKRFYGTARLFTVFFAILFSGGASDISWAGAPPCLPGLPCEFATPPSTPPSSGPNAPKAIETRTATGNNSCDADFMNQIYGRAFLESERENIMNEVVIRKPDSVLEYTCFDQFLSFTAGPGARIFTESTRWRNRTTTIGGYIGPTAVPNVIVNVYMGNDKVDKSLNLLVMESLNKYIAGNFGHEYLGGAAGFDSSTAAAVSGSARYLCDDMYNVYHMAKCNNFGLDDPFMSFSEFVGGGNDPRRLPRRCPGNTKITNALIKLSENENWNYAAAEAVTTYVDTMNIDTQATCQDPIPTGLILESETVTLDLQGNATRSGQYRFEEKVCPNPGCTFNNQGDANPANDTCDP